MHYFIVIFILFSYLPSVVLTITYAVPSFSPLNRLFHTLRISGFDELHSNSLFVLFAGSIVYGKSTASSSSIIYSSFSNCMSSKLTMTLFYGLLVLLA